MIRRWQRKTGWTGRRKEERDEGRRKEDKEGRKIKGGEKEGWMGE